MKYSAKVTKEDKDLSIRILREAVPKMTALDIAVTPINYAVWYEYCLGSNPMLNREIDRMLDAGTPFTSRTNQQLFKEYLTEPEEAERLSSVQVETQSLITGLIRKITQVSQGTMNFSDVLNNFSEQLNDNPDGTTLNRLIEGIGSELAQVIEQNRGMTQSLAQMDKEVGELRSEMEALQSEVMTDPLTTLSNRRAFDQQMQQIFSLPENLSSGFSMMAVDIDFFKKVNDTYGHQAGDKVIAYIGRLLKRCVRQSDFVARYGGEEFVVILPATEFEHALEMAEIVRQAINEKKLSVGSEGNKISLGKVSVSIGVSSFLPSDDIDDCFGRADLALYKAKEAGRNCVRGMRHQADEPMAQSTAETA